MRSALDKSEDFRNIVRSEVEERTPLYDALMHGIGSMGSDPDKFVKALLMQVIQMDRQIREMGKRLEEKERTRLSPDNVLLSDAMVKQLNEGILSRKELDLTRQWFDCVQDTNNAYLQDKDYTLAEKIYNALGMRVPHSVLEKR